MSRVKRTPPLSVKGRFSVLTPYVVDQNNVYEVIAVRYFDDLELDGDSVYTLYYESKSLDRDEYSADAAMGATIVTLRDPHGNVVELPDTFILSYPTMSDYEYRHIVLSVSLGALPNTVDLTHAINEIKGVVNSVLGIPMDRLDVKIGSAPKQGTISPDQHESLEAARVAAITNNVSVYAQNESLRQSLATAQTTIDALIQQLNP